MISEQRTPRTVVLLARCWHLNPKILRQKINFLRVKLSLYAIVFSRIILIPSLPWPSVLWLKAASLSIRLITIFLTLTPCSSSAQDFKNGVRVWMWNSSGKTWMMHSIRYSWAIASRQLTTYIIRKIWMGIVFSKSLYHRTCSKIPGNTNFWYLSSVTDSNWLSLTRLVPTKILSSSRSFSLCRRSLEWPWCCILTWNRTILCKINSFL